MIGQQAPEKMAQSFDIREMQIETQYHSSPNRIVKILKSDHVMCWQIFGKNGILMHC
jgi:hypothetical protein